MRFDGPFDDEQLATLESFSSRFSRFSNLAIKQFLMFRACESDPGFRGSVIDLLNYAEKFNWIEPAAEWRRIRELRNLAHMNIRLRTFWDCIWSSLQKRQFLLC